MIRKIGLFAALCLAAVAAVAERPETFPGSPLDSRTLRVQEKVDELFEGGDYERALFIYKNELAPIGDKYAQYMIGYMHWTGTGVAEDPVTAAAWFRLAAERAHPQFVEIRDQLIDALSNNERERSDAHYLALRRQYSDAVILLRLLKSDLAALKKRTGSRVTGNVGALTIVDPRTGSSESADVHDRRLRNRAEACLKFLNQLLGTDSVGNNLESLDMDALEAFVDRHVTTIADRPESGHEAGR